MSGAGGIETSQLQPLDENPEERRRAAVTCAAHVLETGGGRDELLELLRALGLAHDPLARDRDMIWGTKSSHLRGPEQ